MSQRGSIRKRGETWTAYWFVNDADGKRRQRTKGGFRTKREAQGHLNDVLTAVQHGTYSEPRKMTLAVFLRQEWLPTLTQRASTRASYETVAERWIIPSLGGILLPSLTPAHVQRLLDELRTMGGRRGSGLGPRSVQYALVVLKMATRPCRRPGVHPPEPGLIGEAAPSPGRRDASVDCR
ncbi:MAG: Arm DNA-binding domain-containing protein [Nitriliruptorales bacterium]